MASEVSAGGRLEVRVRLDDPYVTVTSVQVEACGPAAGEVAGPWPLTYDQTSGNWVGPIAIPESAVPGTWQVTHITVTDDEASTWNLENGSPLSFQVSQSAPPLSMQLGSIRTSDADAVRGVPATVDFDVEDSSGLSSVEAVFVGPSGRQRVTAGVVVNPASDLPTSLSFPFQIGFPDGSEPGQWSVECVTVKNGQGATGRFFPGSDATFRVASSAFDTAPPQVLQVDLSRDSLATGESLTVSASVSDELSGVGAVTAVVSSPAGSTAIDLEPSPDGRWTGSLAIPLYAAGGQWTCSIRAADRIGNATAGGGHPQAEASFTVSPAYTEADVPMPAIGELETSGSQSDGRLVARLTVADTGAGVEAVVVRFETPAGKTILVPASPDGEPGHWACVVELPPYSRSGFWQAAGVIVTDIGGRQAEVSVAAAMLAPAGAASVQVVSDGFEDTQPPVIDGAPGVEVVAGRVMFTVRASDDLTGVQSVLLLFGPATALGGEGARGVSRATLYLRYNPQKGLWEGGLPMNQIAAKGEWGIAGIVLTDQAGNDRTLQPGSDYSPALFEVR